MRCPSLCDLPPAPPGKTGWPWTEETPRLADVTPDGRPWPRISIVTPSYNQGQFLEETIRSILLQGYPHLEHIIIDGGSTDETVNIIKKYEPWLAYWVSEKDKGQSHAINKGLARATGRFAAYQNSDDIYWPGAFQKVGELFNSDDTDALFATVDLLNEQSVRRPPVCPIPEPRLDVIIRFWRGPSNILPSQGFFFRLELLRSLGFFDERFHYKMDFDVICRVVQRVPASRIIRSDQVIAGYRVMGGTKTGMMSSERSAQEGLAISMRYWDILAEGSGTALREARGSLSRMALYRAFYATDQGDLRAVLRELGRAWRYQPSTRVVRWGLYLMLRFVRSFREGRYSCA